MGTNFDEFDKNKLSIITFNYDRSLEYFLFNSLKATYGKRNEEVTEELSKLQIVHMYGQIGLLPWQKGGFIREYNFQSNSNDDIKNSADGIKIVTEGKQESEFGYAQLLLKNAEYIYFLGFGYHPENLKRLQIKELDNLRNTIYGTALRLTDRQVESIMKSINNKIDLKLPGSQTYEILPYLKHNISFI